MKWWLRQRWYRLRDGFRDRVWEFADRIDPAVGNERQARAEAMDELQRYVAVELSRAERLDLLLFATPIDVMERALRKAALQGFQCSLKDEAERARELAQ